MFEGIAKTLCKLIDDHIAVLGGNLVRIGELIPQ
jgi:hypothetical protein